MGWKEELERLRGAVPEGQSPAPAASASAGSATATATATKAKGPARAVVRYERKGHGGKEATVVEKLELPERELEAWLKSLKQSLGCGGRVTEGAIVLQGDQRERLPPLLTAKGVRKVTVSG